ncbi:conjugal transfer protein TraD [Sphingomonas sp. 22176]|uniref:conjugal transfer protein TraD n=1 Tax=Sphingomonas sp. 22176 TaxID=3453884 RepID=UPI003F84CA2A
MRHRLRQLTAAPHRLEGQRARNDTRAWVVKRRERTRQLIELGGLVAEAGLVELTDDDRAVLFGLMVEAAVTLRGDDSEHALTLWRRRGRRAFADNDAEL